MDSFENLSRKIKETLYIPEKLLFLTGTEIACYNFIKLAGEKMNIPSVNLSLTLTEKLLPFSIKESIYKVSEILENIIAENQSPLIFKSIEILFEPSLEVNLFVLFKKLSRSYPLIVLWPGEYDGKYLTYGNPGHREYIKEEYISELIISL